MCNFDIQHYPHGGLEHGGQQERSNLAPQRRFQKRTFAAPQQIYLCI
jgi:hypothetical protein